MNSVKAIAKKIIINIFPNIYWNYKAKRFDYSTII